MAVPLTVHNAEIHTATVEIRTLTVSGRQVTQAVFRQLESEAVVDQDTGRLRGVPWGRVNYHPSTACKNWDEDHLHVVWQKGSQLRRAAVKKPIFFDFYPGDETPIYLQGHYCANGHELPSWLGTGDRWNTESVFFTVGGMACRAVKPDKHFTWNAETRQHEDGSDACVEVDSQLGVAIRISVDAEARRRLALIDSWKQLVELPQLFIAV